MKLTAKNNLYLQRLYLNAGKTVMDNLFSLCRPHINYTSIQQIANAVSAAKSSDTLTVNDRYYVFFHNLCCKLSNELYAGEPVYYIFSPVHNRDVICQMIVPCQNIIFINCDGAPPCKADNLYTSSIPENYTGFLETARYYFEKHIKKQQEYR